MTLIIFCGDNETITSQALQQATGVNLSEALADQGLVDFLVKAGYSIQVVKKLPSEGVTQNQMCLILDYLSGMP